MGNLLFKPQHVMKNTSAGTDNEHFLKNNNMNIVFFQTLIIFNLILIIIFIKIAMFLNNLLYLYRCSIITVLFFIVHN